MADNLIVGTLRALLTLDSAQFEAGLRKSEKSLDTFAKTSGRLGRQASDLGARLTAGVTVPLVALGAGAARAAIQFESSFTGVRKTVDATEAQFAMLSQGFRDMAKEVPINVNELNRLGEAAGQLGVKTEDILGFSRTMAELGVTTNLSADEAATGFARFANIINNEAGPQYDRLGAATVALGNNLETTEAEILQFGLRIAGAGKQIGLAESEILAIGGALSSVGINAEAGGTAISRVMVEIAKAVANGGAELGKFASVAGLSASEFRTAFQTDAAGALTTFVEGLGRVTDEGGNTFQVLEDLGLQSIRVRDALLRASGAGDLMREALELGNHAWRDNEALTKEAALRFATVESKLTVLWNRIADVGQTLGEGLLPVLERFVDFLTASVVPKIDEAVQAFLKMPAPLQGIAAGLLAMTAAAPPALFVLGQLGLAASGAAALLGKGGLLASLGTASAALMGLVTGPLGLTVATLAAAGGLLWALGITKKDFQDWGSTVQTAIRGVNDAWDEFRREILGLEYVKPRLSQLEQSLRQIQPEAEKVGGAFEVITDASELMGKSLEEIAQPARRTFEGITAAGEEAEASARSAAAAWAELQRMIASEGTIQRPLAQVLETFGDLRATTTTFLATLPATTQNMSAFWLATARGAEGALPTVKEFQAQIAQIGTQLEAEAPPTFFQSLVNVGRNAVSQLNTVFKAAFEGGGALAGALQSLATTIAAGVLAMIPVVGAALAQFAGAIVSGFKAIFKKLFGGPSEQELAGRSAAASFRDGIVSELESHERIEIDRVFGAGSSRGTAGFLFGISKQFQEIGFSAEQARARTAAFARELHLAERRGPAAVQKVIDGFNDQIAAARDYQAAIKDLASAEQERAALLEQTLEDGAADWNTFIEQFNDFLSDLAGGALVEAFEPIIAAQEIMAGKWAPFVKGAEAGARAMLALGTTGNLTQREFGFVAQAAKRTFNGLIRGGADGKAAIEAMRPTLAALMFAQENYGLRVDKGTQAILDQARAHGVTAAEGETAADRQLAALEKMIDGLERLIDLFENALPDAITNLPDGEVNVRVNVEEVDLDGPRVDYSGSSRPGGFALGTRNLDFQSFAPGGTRTVLHGDEAVIPRGRAHELASEIAAALPMPRFDTSRLEARLASIERATKNQAAEMALMFKVALLQAGVNT